jgi:hypothetical protein
MFRRGLFVFMLLAGTFLCAAVPNRLPIVFETNVGQAPPDVNFCSQRPNGSLSLSSGAATVHIQS